MYVMIHCTNCVATTRTFIIKKNSHCRMILSLRMRNAIFICSNSWWFAAFSLINRRICALTLCSEKCHKWNCHLVYEQKTWEFTLWIFRLCTTTSGVQVKHLAFRTKCWNCTHLYHAVELATRALVAVASLQPNHQHFNRHRERFVA